jgi:hypothetical protein
MVHRYQEHQADNIPLAELDTFTPQTAEDVYANIPINHSRIVRPGVNDPKYHAFVCLVKFGDETVDPISCPDMSYERGSGEPTVDRRDSRRGKT